MLYAFLLYGLLTVSFGFMLGFVAALMVFPIKSLKPVG